MGWFDSIIEVGRKALSAVKAVASKAIDFMANKAEKYVGKVKELWKNVKPYVEKAQMPLRVVAKVTAQVPVLGIVTNAVSIGVDNLLKLENSPVLKKIEKAIIFASDRAKALEAQIKDGKIGFLSAEEYEQATKSRKAFREVEESVTPAQRQEFERVSAVNDFLIAKTDIQTAIEGEPQDFQHYLRLRATQKLLRIEESKLLAANSLDGLSEDDWFIVRIASDLIKADPELQAQAAERLDRILSEQYGKTLQSFIYEELIASWKKRAEALGNDMSHAAKLLATSRNDLRRLQSAKAIQEELDEVEAQALTLLENELPKQEAAFTRLSTEKSDVERYADAAEGFLQLLEKSVAQLEQEDREFVLTDGADVGRIIVEAAQNNTPFSELSEVDRRQVVDFANIFGVEAEARMKAVLEMAA